MATFQEASGIPAQVIPITTTAQVFTLDTSRPHYYFLLESDDICYVRTGGDMAQASDADIPMAPGSYGTKRRGNHTRISVKSRSGNGTLTIAYGSEVE